MEPYLRKVPKCQANAPTNEMDTIMRPGVDGHSAVLTPTPNHGERGKDFMRVGHCWLNSIRLCLGADEQRCLLVSTGLGPEGL